MMFNHRQQDEALVRQLGQLGLDLKRPQIVEHFFYFSKPDRAEQAALELRSQGYVIQAATEPCDGIWSVVGRGQLLPHGRTFSRIRTRMEQLAAKSGGVYDGWGLQFVAELQ